MRAPSLNRTRRYPIVDEIDSPNVLPPLDRPFDSILTPRTRLRTHTEDPLTRRLLGQSTALALRRTSRPPRESNRKVIDDPLSPSLIRVEMLSCDGGSLDFDDSGRYNAENLLLDNISVYCTAKLENVNILLRGAGSRPFTLSRIEIKAPQRSFTSPVKDGLIFISMDRINVCDTRIYDRDQDKQDCNDNDDDKDDDDSDSDSSIVGCMDDTNLQRLLDGQSLEGTTTQLDDADVAKEILRPHAYFVVDERTGSATITFEPAVSGCYVHVKLLSGQPFDSYPGRFERDNIDIQAILLYGWGRRIFPSFEYR